MKKRLFNIILISLSIIGLCACGGTKKPEEKPDDPKKEEEKFDMSLIENSKPSTIVKDYTYMYHIDGLKDKQKDRLAFFSDNYQMLVDSRNGKLLGLQSCDKASMVDPSKLASVTSKFEIEIENQKYEITKNGEGRIIDSGRYVNRYDNVTLSFDGLDNENYFGRIEYVANRDFVVFNYELYSLFTFQYSLTATFTLDGYQLSKIDDRSIVALDSKGNGFIFCKEAVGDNVDVTISGNNLVIKKSVVDYVNRTFRGLGIVIIPYYQESPQCYDRFIANENAVISASIKNGNNLEAKYDPTDGVHYIDHNAIYANAKENVYDDVNFSVRNNSSTDVRPILCFTKSTNVSITGVSPMIVDSSTYEPTGEIVQISKNWHTYTTNKSDFNYADSNSPKRLYQGPWLHGYCRINVPHKGEATRDYMLVYGKFGDGFAASHAQLCLIGYSGLQVWDQSALGSWGETVTYDPDVGLGRAMIDDVRPFLVTSPIGSNMQYNWTGNIGGADFLRYSDKAGYHNIVNQRLSYLTQGPCVTHVNYSGNTNDGKIKTSISINMGRTNDIPRSFYNLEYEFLEDVSYTELVFFKLCGTSYSDNWFTKCAYGDYSGVIAKDLSCADKAENVVHTATEDDFFFGLYNSTDVDENGDEMLCVREFKANINGQEYTKPGYKLVDTTNGNKQVACEIVLPAECEKVIKKGSKVKLVIEYDILPNSNTYYGNSSYIHLTKEFMGTADEFYQQVYAGKLNVKVTNGELVTTYPLNIYSKKDETIEFTLGGGLGYVPVLLDGLSSYSGYKLQKKVNNEFVDVDQSSANYSNDFYQCYYNELTNKYQFGYNISNTEGINFDANPNDYRLVKVK